MKHKKPSLVEFDPFPLDPEPTIKALEEAITAIQNGECEGLAIAFCQKGKTLNYHSNTSPSAREKLIGGLYVMQQALASQIVQDTWE